MLRPTIKTQTVNQRYLKRLRWHVTQAHQLLDDNPKLAKSQLVEALKDLHNLTADPEESAGPPEKSFAEKRAALASFLYD